MNLKELQPSFLDSIFDKGSLIAQCGFCKTVHYCLDHPDDSWGEVLGVSEAAPWETEDEGKESMANAIRGFENQQDSGINSCYEPSLLVQLIRGSLIPDDIFGPTIEEKVAGIFHCKPDRGAELLNMFPPLKEGIAAKAHLGLENIQNGSVDGLKAVVGCCEPRLLLYQKLWWNDRAKIAAFVSEEARLQAEEASHNTASAKKLKEAVKKTNKKTK